MRSSILLIAATASTVSAAVIRSSPVKLPSSAFPKFHTISLEDAINGVDLNDAPEPAMGACPAQYNTPSPTSTGEIITLTVQPPTTSATSTDGGGRQVSLPGGSVSTASTSAAVTSTAKTSAAVSTSTSTSTSTSVATSTPTAGSCTNPEIRQEWGSYSTANRQKFLAAIKCLVDKAPSGNFPPATSRFEDLARLHQLYMPYVHGNPEFLVWHRYFLWTFEQLLQVECGLDVPMPWWDETKVASDFASSDLFSDDYFGQLSGPDSEGDPTCVTTGVFANLVANIGPGSDNIPHCLSRSWETSQTANCNSEFVSTCNARSSYSDMESCSEDGPHAYGHNGIGGVMADVSASPSDPIFWMHHTFVDHMFYSWEQTDSSVRTTSINGDDHNGVPLTMSYVLQVGDIFPNITISDVMSTMSGAKIGDRTFCYSYDY